MFAYWKRKDELQRGIKRECFESVTIVGDEDDDVLFVGAKQTPKRTKLGRSCPERKTRSSRLADAALGNTQLADDSLGVL
jgi:hypothetical protein